MAKKKSATKPQKKSRYKPAARVTNGGDTSFVIGSQYLIRTVTHYYTGRLAAITNTDLVLEDAAWVASTGRFYDSLKNSTVDECEPFVNPVIVQRGAIVDATVWNGNLPRDQK